MGCKFVTARSSCFAASLLHSSHRSRSRLKPFCAHRKRQEPTRTQCVRGQRSIDRLSCIQETDAIRDPCFITQPWPQGTKKATLNEVATLKSKSLRAVTYRSFDFVGGTADVCFSPPQRPPHKLISPNLRISTETPEAPNCRKRLRASGGAHSELLSGFYIWGCKLVSTKLTYMYIKHIHIHKHKHMHIHKTNMQCN